MPANKLEMLYFSPTGTTRKVVETIAGSIQAERRAATNLTNKAIRESGLMDSNSDLVIIGAPVYAGRIPKVVADYFARTRVNNIHAVLVVLYGNREYDDALMELYDVASTAGFIPIACAAFIGEHSFATEELPMAPGRPDDTDLEKARQFGVAIQQSIDSLLEYDSSHRILIPGNGDYKKKVRPQYPIKPGRLNEECTLCEVCIEACPVAAISIDERSDLKTNIDLCIMCFACVKLCPAKARGIDNSFWSAFVENLHKLCLQRKEPEIYF